MPNVKLFIDRRHLPAVDLVIADLLPDLRDWLCASLGVGPDACQIAALPVMGLADQPQINTELHVLPGIGRTPDRMRQLALDLRDRVAAATGLRVAVRIAMLDPDTYITLK